MNWRKSGTTWAGGLCLLLAAIASPLSVAVPLNTAVREINHLLEHVGESGCEFYRNGAWFNGNLGQAHLRDKYEWLARKDVIITAADFIDKAASQSSMSGLAYKVRCKGQEETTTRQWLTEELLRYRAADH